MQYLETDWAFAKRLASHFQTVIVPGYTTSGVKLYFGPAQRGGAAKISPPSCRIEKRLDEYLYKEQNQVEGLMEDDSLIYIVEEREKHAYVIPAIKRSIHRQERPLTFPKTVFFGCRGRDNIGNIFSKSAPFGRIRNQPDTGVFHA